MDDSFDLTGYDTDADAIDSTDTDLASDIPESDDAIEEIDSLESIDDAEIPDIDIEPYEDAVMADADLNTEDIETLDAPEMPDEDGLAEGMDDSELSELLNDAESLDIQPFENEAGDFQEESADTAHGWPVPSAEDKAEMWQAGLNAIDNTMEALRDDLRDKGYTDEEFIEQTIAPVRAGLMDELGRNIDGDLSNPYIMPDFNNLEALAGDMDQDGSALQEGETGDLPDTPVEGAPEVPCPDGYSIGELSEDQGDADIAGETGPSLPEEYGDTEDLAGPDGNAGFGTEPAEDDEIEITPIDSQEDVTEPLEQSPEGIEVLETAEDAPGDAVAEDMQETVAPVDTAPEIETLELAEDASDDGIAEEMQETEAPTDAAPDVETPGLMEDAPGDETINEMPEDEVPDEVYEGLTLPEQADELTGEEAEALEPQTDSPVEQNADLPPEIDLQAVYEGLDEYDFDNIDYAADPERLDGCLDGFTDSTWENSTLEEKQEQIERLKEYVE